MFRVVRKIGKRFTAIGIAGSLLALVGLLMVFPAPAAFAAKSGHFTDQQAKAGEQVYKSKCAVCHGSRMQGGAGPALKGSKFASSVKFGNLSASQLYDFISTHMPKTNPGGLTQKQYLHVFAYILSQNGFSSGKKPLDKKAIKRINLLPLPGSGAHASSKWTGSLTPGDRRGETITIMDGGSP